MILMDVVELMCFRCLIFLYLLELFLLCILRLPVDDGNKVVEIAFRKVVKYVPGDRNMDRFFERGRQHKWTNNTLMTYQAGS